MRKLLLFSLILLVSAFSSFAANITEGVSDEGVTAVECNDEVIVTLKFDSKKNTVLGKQQKSDALGCVFDIQKGSPRKEVETIPDFLDYMGKPNIKLNENYQADFTPESNRKINEWSEIS